MAAPMRTWGFTASAKRAINYFLKTGPLRPNRANSLRVRCCSSSTERWQLVSAVCLERPPVVIAELNEFEQTYASLLEKMELEGSVLSNHELWHQDDLALASRRKVEDYEETEAEAMRVTAIEMEDLWEAELASFTPASRTTVADEAGDQATTDRQLDRKLVLLVQQQLGAATRWVLPQGPRQEGETMRQAAERVLRETCGTEMSARFIGNAPVGFYKYRYPKDTTEGAPVGAKVFFFKAQFEGGQVRPGSLQVHGFSWLTKEEWSKILNPIYRDRINKFILEL